MKNNINELISGAKWGFFESISTRIIGIIFNFTVVWFISPEQLGLLAIFTVLHQILSITQNFGIYDFLLFNKDRFNNLYPSCYFILISVCFLCVIILLFYKVFFFDFQQSELSTLFYLYSISLIPGAIQSIPKVKLYLSKNFNMIYKIKISEFFINKFLTIILLLFGFSLISFGIALLVSSVFSWLCFQSVSGLNFSIRTDNLRFIFNQVKFTIGYTLSRAFNHNLDFIVIGFFNTKILGIYFMAFSLSSQIVTLVSRSMLKNIHAVLNSFKVGENSKDIINFLFAFSAFAFPIAFFQGFISVPIINVFFPEQWTECIPHIQILSIAAAFRISTNLWIPLTKSLGRFSYLFKISIIENLLFFILLYSLISKFGEYGAPFSYLIITLLIGLVALANSLKEWKINAYIVFKNIFVSFILTLITFLPLIYILIDSRNNFYLVVFSVLSLSLNYFYYYYFRQSKYYMLKEMLFKNK